jgi:hypothetical protein
MAGSGSKPNTKVSRYLRAKANFAAQPKDTAVRAQPRICGQMLPDGGECTAQGIYVERFRGTAYHFRGICEAGHVTERFGYADKPVIDP